MSSLRLSDSVVVAASPEAVYDVVSDVTRTGEWSPQCRECWWLDGGTGAVGDEFGGRQETPERTWETRSRVEQADRGRAFAWSVNDRKVLWRYDLEPVDGGTRLTESWEFTDAGLQFMADKYGPDAEHEIATRQAAAREGVPATLAAIRRIVEGGGR
ncbi:Polyketide cyclase / dehydrase and lipid transport [Klenkia marina]|uniref:Polyketide cyclase / dehydrase and lipid transport n=1 Tax=Klenkia marina TaxID=1960309 RepID=A0A1G4Z1Q6_9ACTN|nr:SRPBCC family protein [Klenkia marina]SCX59617.1 Polyketide cyclase / dehydrase and lipid transport [Klenkia marina]